MNKARTLLVALVIIALGAAGMVVSERRQVEITNTSVEIALDLDEIRLLSAATPDVTIDDALHYFQRAGATSIAVTEPILGDLLSSGLATYHLVGYHQGQPAYQILSTDPQLQARINNALVQNGLIISAPSALAVFPYAEVTGLEQALLARLPLGFTMQEDLIITLQHKHGLNVIARAWNFSAVSKQSLEALSDNLHRMGIDTIIFAGDEVAGWRGAIDLAAEIFKTTDLHFGSIEFARQKGSDALQRKLDGEYLRVHSISPAEMANYHPAAAVERFVRAARERNLRILYVRMLTTGGTDALQQNLDYISSITAGLQKAGLQPGKAGILPDPQPAKWQLVLIALGVAAAGVLMFSEFFALRLGWQVLLLLALSLVFIGASLLGDLGRKIIALACALFFPVWAIARCARHTEPGPKRRFPIWVEIPGHYITAIGLAVFAGVIIAGTLSGRVFMMATDGFAGVKIAHLLPILALALPAAIGTLGTPLPAGDFHRQIQATVRRIWVSPVLFSYAIVGLIALVMLFVVVLRSGHDAGVGVSAMELRFRAVLDQILYVRPRTKEIFLGYPALWAAIWLSLKGERAWASLFFVAAVIGLISAVNTFCHIHTPFAISFLRVINGAWVGAIGGIILVLILKQLGFGRPAKGG